MFHSSIIAKQQEKEEAVEVEGAKTNLLPKILWNAMGTKLEIDGGGHVAPYCISLF